MKSLRLISIFAVLGLLVGASAPLALADSSAPPGGFTVVDVPQPVAVNSLPDPEGKAKIMPDGTPFVRNGMTSIVVKLDAASLLSYTGGVAGLAPTSPSVSGRKFNQTDAPSRAYLRYLNGRIAAFEQAAVTAVPDAKVANRFNLVYGGVSMVLPMEAVEKIAALPGVVSVQYDSLNQAQTEVSPQFIGADSLWADLGGQSVAGEGVIVGDIDTGIWPEHPSFSDPDPAANPYPVPPASWTGTVCDFGNTAWNANDAPFTCNNKLIGARQSLATYKAAGLLTASEYNSARDNEGHGTHTASTAAGNAGVAASIFGVPRGIVSGVAPRAHIAAYKSLGNLGGFSSDLAAAVQMGIADGVDVFNYSISGGTSPYTDVASLAFLDAYNAGILVSASAGNSGPGANTVGHREGWTITVAASTADRSFLTPLTVTGGGTPPTGLVGASVTAGFTGIARIPALQTGDTAGQLSFCAKPFASGTFAANEIVLCRRGGTAPGSARLQKSKYVMDGGAGGFILINATANSGLNTDNHFLPAVHLEFNATGFSTPGMDLYTYVNGEPPGSVTLSWPDSAATATPGDLMTSFSSRGGSSQSLGWSKPDVTAPGIQILAGNSALPNLVTSGPPGQLFQAIAGTSMSAPHVTGSAALLFDLHPDWTPGQVKSALMTTSFGGVLKEDGVTPANAFDDGSGRIDLTMAGDPGVTFDVPGAAFPPANGNLYAQQALNYPSIYVNPFPGEITLRKTAHSELAAGAVWTFSRVAPPGVSIRLPGRLYIPAGASRTFPITIYAPGLAAGTYFAHIYMNSPGQNTVHIPVTIVPGNPPVTLTKTCAPGTIAKGDSTTCTITFTNNAIFDARVEMIDAVPARLRVDPASVTGGARSVRNTVAWRGMVGGANPPLIDVVDDEGGSPAGGYLPLSLFGVAPIAGVGDDTIHTFDVPAFKYGGETYTRVRVGSNGYIVVGSGAGSADITFSCPAFPNSANPNNVISPFCTDLNPPAGGAIRIATLTDGVDTWIVVEWEGVKNFSDANTASFQIWLTTGAVEGNWMVYAATNTGDAGGGLAIGAENKIGSSGKTWYRNGVGPLPTSATELRVLGTPPTAAESKTVTFSATGTAVGIYVNCARLSSNAFLGFNIRCFMVTVTP